MEKSGDSFKCYMVSWDEAYRLAKAVTRKIKSSGFRPDLVIGIARGGLVPARTVCDFLIHKDLVSIKVEHWGIAQTHGKAKIAVPLPDEVDISGKRILIVDDVADTGDSFSVITEYLKDRNPAEIRTAALHYKTCSTFVPDYWGEIQEEWKWIIYPWAVFEDMTGFINTELTLPMTAEDIRKSLMTGHDIDMSQHDLLDILDEMLMSGMLRKRKRDGEVLWERTQ